MEELVSMELTAIYAHVYMVSVMSHVLQVRIFSGIKCMKYVKFANLPLVITS